MTTLWWKQMDEDNRARLTRRQVAAGGAVAASGLLGGCLGSMRQFLGFSSLDQISLRVMAPPADWDRRANEIAGQLVERLKQVGIDTRFPLVPPRQFRRQVLYDRDFDLYVGTMPIGRDPDYLRPLLTSTYTDALGWQNPFGFADISLDESLAQQHRQTGEERTDTIRRVLDTVAGEQPLVPIATDQAIAAISTDAFEGWERAPLRDPTWLLELEPASDSATDETLRITTKDGSITQQLNPLVPWINEFDLVTSLLYDPLARYYDDAVRPWLAEDWELVTDDDELTVTLRSDLYWHDGKPITAEDVEFTYDFLEDTALGNADAEYPAPRFQGQAQAVDTVTVETDRTVRFRVDSSAATAPALLTVPLLPKHVWRSRTRVSNARRGITRAIGHDNTGAVGSGPMTLANRTEGESVRFSRFEEHPLNRDDGSPLADRFGQLAFSELVVSLTPSDLTMVAYLRENAADVTAPSLDNKIVSGVVSRDGLSLATSESRTLYHVGFNTRRRPLRNPSFRRAVAHLINKGAIVESIFDGYAEPRTTPVRGDSWIPEDLRWNNGDPEVPFAGVEDELFTENARKHFSNAGYHYTDDDILVY